MGPRRVLTVLLTTLLLVCAPQARAQEADEEIARDLVHSDLPLFGGGENTWPHAFYSEDSFGCTSRVAFGDWALRDIGAEGSDAVAWYRVLNYGTFHCWAMIGHAYERQDLENVDFRPSFFVLLGTTEIEGATIELWAIQFGARPGSDYLLLTRPQQSGAVEQFSVLQTECRRADVRDAGTLAILLTRYCAINSRADLLRLARHMAQRPARATLSRVEAQQGDESN
jgi:hypothetical protein